jgi:hypothetical protein
MNTADGERGAANGERRASDWQRIDVEIVESVER